VFESNIFPESAKTKMQYNNRIPKLAISLKLIKIWEVPKMKSFIAKPHEVEHKWYVVDAEGKTLGRLASEVASVLRGKHKPIYTPHVDTGDYVIIVNAEKVEVTGKKRQQSYY